MFGQAVSLHQTDHEIVLRHGENVIFENGILGVILQHPYYFIHTIKI